MQKKTRDILIAVIILSAIGSSMYLFIPWTGSSPAQTALQDSVNLTQDKTLKYNFLSSTLGSNAFDDSRWITGSGFGQATIVTKGDERVANLPTIPQASGEKFLLPAAISVGQSVEVIFYFNSFNSAGEWTVQFSSAVSVFMSYGDSSVRVSYGYYGGTVKTADHVSSGSRIDMVYTLITASTITININGWSSGQVANTPSVSWIDFWPLEGTSISLVGITW